jgi:hypothetical protein
MANAPRITTVCMMRPTGSEGSGECVHIMSPDKYAKWGESEWLDLPTSGYEYKAIEPNPSQPLRATERA